jgi:hypothetical protein
MAPDRLSQRVVYRLLYASKVVSYLERAIVLRCVSICISAVSGKRNSAKILSPFELLD